MKIQLTTLTPVHIGSGTDISPLDYVIDNGFTRINMQSLFRSDEFKPMLEPFITAMATVRYIGEHVPLELLRAHPQYTIPVRGEASEYVEGHQTTVKEQIKSAARLYIPGSSLKGSILSALYWYTLKSAKGKYLDELAENIRAHRFDAIKKMAFKWMTRQHPNIPDFRRWADVSDSSFLPCSEALELSLVKIQGAKTGEEQPILYETIQVGRTFEMELISRQLKYDENRILEICDAFYHRVLEHDLYQIELRDGSLCRIGQGSSAFATSLLILAEDLDIEYRTVRPPKTRKRIDQRFPMGWVKLQPNGSVFKGSTKKQEKADPPKNLTAQDLARA